MEKTIHISLTVTLSDESIYPPEDILVTCLQQYARALTSRPVKGYAYWFETVRKFPWMRIKEIRRNDEDEGKSL